MSADDRAVTPARHAAPESPATEVVHPARPPAFPSGHFTIGLAVTIVVLDQTTKALVREYLPLHSSVSLVGGFLDLTHVRNTGAAFGFLNAVDIPFKPALMTAIALVALIAIAVYTSRVTAQAPLARLGLALILGGAVGNLTDRITAGYVIDFVDVYWGAWHFWAFNVADAAITIGACALIIDMAFPNRHVSEAV